MREKSAIRSIPAGVFLLTVVLSSTSCGRDVGDGGGHRFRVHTEAGVTVAENTGGPRFGSELFTYEPVLEIRDDPAVEASLLNRPSGFVETSSGEFLVLDSGDCRIAVFDGSGRYLRSFGGKGSGPGEFQYPLIQGAADGRIYLYDLNIRRTTCYDEQGDLVATLVEPPGVSGGIMMRSFTPGGGIVAWYLQNSREEGLTWERMVASFWSSSGDSLAGYVDERFRGGFYEETYTASGQFRSRRNGRYMYGGSVAADYRPGSGLILVHPERAELLVLSDSGTVIRRIRTGRTPEPVTEIERDNLKRPALAFAEQMEEPGRSRQLASLESMRFAERLGLWETVMYDDAGYVWLGVLEPFGPDGRPAAKSYDLISPQGEYLGRTRPPGWGDVRVMNGHYLTFITDEESGQRIPTVFALHPAVDGFVYR